MARNFIRKYYPSATKKSPYVILEPEEYTSMMAEEYVKYSDPHVSKLKSFSKLARIVILLWFVLGIVVLVNQLVPTVEIRILGTKSESFIRTFHMFWSSDESPELPEDLQEKKLERIYQGLEKCVPGENYKPDSCNTCRCDDRGNLACTKMFCPKDFDAGGMNPAPSESNDIHILN